MMGPVPRVPRRSALTIIAIITTITATITITITIIIIIITIRSYMHTTRPTEVMGFLFVRQNTCTYRYICIDHTIRIYVYIYIYIYICTHVCSVICVSCTCHVYVCHACVIYRCTCHMYVCVPRVPRRCLSYSYTAVFLSKGQFRRERYYAYIYIYIHAYIHIAI